MVSYQSQKKEGKKKKKKKIKIFSGVPQKVDIMFCSVLCCDVKNAERELMFHI